MRRIALTSACIVCFLLTAISALSEPGYILGNRLLGHVARGEIESVEDLLEQSAFGQEVLGQAMLTTLALADEEGFITERDTFRVVQLLIAKGAKVNQPDAYGRTPLMEACLKNFESTAWILLKAGANPFLTDRFGLSAYEYAKNARGDRETITWLIEKAREDQATFTVKNIRLRLQGDAVYVYYDLEGPFPAKVRLNAEGGGMKLLPRHVSGDVGAKVQPGTDRKIVWSLKKDLPKGFKQKEMTLDVMASSK